MGRVPNTAFRQYHLHLVLIITIMFLSHAIVFLDFIRISIICKKNFCFLTHMCMQVPRFDSELSLSFSFDVISN